MTGNYSRMSKVDVKIDHARLQLMVTKISLANYLTKRYGDLPQAKQLWIDALRRMRQHDFPTLIENEAVKSVLEDLEK